MLFFKCIAALVNPVYRRGEPIKWGLVSYTMVMFLVVTVKIAIDLHTQSISYVDNREYPGNMQDGIVPGPMGYQLSVSNGPLPTLSGVTFLLNAWLADGLLVSSLLDAAFTHLGVKPQLSPSSIVVGCSTPRASGSSPFPASCSSARSVRI